MRTETPYISPRLSGSVSLVRRLAVATLSVAIVSLAPTAGLCADKRQPVSKPSPLGVKYFYSEACKQCKRASKTINAMESKWGGRIAIERLDCDTLAGITSLLACEKQFGAKKGPLPKVLIVGEWMVGPLQIEGRLDTVISDNVRPLGSTQPSTSPASAPASKPATSKPAASQPATIGRTSDAQREPTPVDDGKLPPEIQAYFESFSVGAVVIAGLADGINPCAFATIVFLISLLNVLKKSRHDLAMVGIGFTLAVFATYFLLGLGFLKAIKFFAVTSGVSTGLAYIAASMAFVLAAWSAVDFVRYVRSHDAHKITLHLPRRLQTLSHKVIHVGLHTGWLFAGAVFIGVVVSLLESLCTGQVYGPTLVFVARQPELRTAAIGYLLLYNVMFIIPLVLILCVAWCGVGSQRLGGFLHAHLGLLKIAMAILFTGLGTLVLLTV